MALEELGKVTILVGEAVLLLAQEEFSQLLEFNWAKADKKVRDHIEKLNRSIVTFKGLLWMYGIDATEYPSLFSDDFARKYNGLKNNSLYAGWVDGNYCIPSQLVTGAESGAMLWLSGAAS